MSKGCCDYFVVDRNVLSMAVMIVVQQQLKTSSQMVVQWDG